MHPRRLKFEHMQKHKKWHSCLRVLCRTVFFLAFASLETKISTISAMKNGATVLRNRQSIFTKKNVWLFPVERYIRAVPLWMCAFWNTECRSFSEFCFGPLSGDCPGAPSAESSFQQKISTAWEKLLFCMAWAHVSTRRCTVAAFSDERSTGKDTRKSADAQKVKECQGEGTESEVDSSEESCWWVVVSDALWDSSVAILSRFRWLSAERKGYLWLIDWIYNWLIFLPRDDQITQIATIYLQM